MLNFVYQPRKTDEELAAIILVFCQDCGHLDAGQFRDAVQYYRRRSRWFPVPADILEAHKAITADRQRVKKLLELAPPPLCQEQIRENLERIARIRDRLSARRSYQQAVNGSPHRSGFANINTVHARRVKQQAASILGKGEGA